jgi:hypothetical protein
MNTNSLPTCAPSVANADNDVDLCELVDTAQCRLRWAYESLHLSQAGFIRLFIDLRLTDFLGEAKSASTIKAYLQGNIPKSAPELFDKLVLAAACFFNLDPADFFNTALHREEFQKRVLEVFQHHWAGYHELMAQNESLKTRLAHLENQLEQSAATLPHEPSETVTVADGQPRPPAKPVTSRAGRAFPVLAASVIGFCAVLITAALVWQGATRTDPYPPRSAPEIKTATLDGRDLWLNSAATPMMAAYGSKLCVSLASDGLYVSVFMEDRGYYFNQEGRVLFHPEDQGEQCTGIWPGMPETFHRTPYKLFILVSAERPPVTGNADRRTDLPPGSYFGPVYLQRTE